MLIVVTVLLPINVLVIPEQLVILTRHVDRNERTHVVKHRVELALNAVKMVQLSTVYVPPAISAMHMFNVTILMNARTELVVKVRFVLIHQEATIANVNQDQLGKLFPD